MTWREYVKQAELLLSRNNLIHSESMVARADAIITSEVPDEIWSKGALFGASQILLWMSEKK